MVKCLLDQPRVQGSPESLPPPGQQWRKELTVPDHARGAGKRPCCTAAVEILCSSRHGLLSTCNTRCSHTPAEVKSGRTQKQHVLFSAPFNPASVQTGKLCSQHGVKCKNHWEHLLSVSDRLHKPRDDLLRLTNLSTILPPVS